MSNSHSPAIEKHPAGITTVDCQFMQPGFASMHIVERRGCVALVDCGTNDSVPEILSALDSLGLSRSSVQWLFLTHVHLDHAGGAGRLLRELPNARVLVHPRGSRHLVDPTALTEASAAVYGQEAFERLYGVLEPINKASIVESTDGQSISLGGDEFTILHTPGHALHHHVLFDRKTAGIFTGDTFGLSYRSTDSSAGAFIVPTTTPTQFDPEQLRLSIERIVQLQPKAAYLTHFGCVTGIVALADALKEQLEQLVRYARKYQRCDKREQLIREEIRQFWQSRLVAHGVSISSEQFEEIFGSDLLLNAQGLVAWLKRLER